MNKMFNLVGAVLIVIAGCLSALLAISLVSILVNAVGGMSIAIIMAFLTCVYIVYRLLEENK